jgi:UDP-N-acetylglucosamine--N-acetylmuramyl-(pentapeptide) pyrophosphoryl-undecaprenol N-acetylglucosamine transferase
MRVLIAGGGTGGHLFPGFAIARSLRRLHTGAEISWLGGQRGLEARLVPDAGFPLTLLPARSLRESRGGLIAAVRDALLLVLSVPPAIAFMRRVRPDVLISTGGYIAIPAMIAAALTRTPSLIWEGNVIPGRSNTLVAPLASARAVAWAATRARAPWSGAEATVTGTPIRDLGAVDRKAARRILGTADGERLLLVFGGSQRVQRFEVALDTALTKLLASWRVLHVVGDDDGRSLARTAALPAALRSRYRTVPFLDGGAMEEALVAADVLLGRAGASTVAEAAAAGLPSIIVPYPFASGHQRANAEALAEVGGALLIDDRDFTAQALLDAVATLEDATVRARVGAAAQSLARPDAADAVARIALGLVERRQHA